MLLKEILTEVDLLAPNAVSQEHKITFINQIQNEVFREIHLNTNSYTFTTVPGQEVYVLPANCQPESLIDVFIDGKKYTEQAIDEQLQGNRYTIVNGDLQIQPVPSTEYEGELTYYVRPTQLSKDNLNTVPDLPSDFHELLSLGCAKKVALAMKDIDSYKVFAELYAGMIRDVVIKLSPKPSHVRQLRRWV